MEVNEAVQGLQLQFQLGVAPSGSLLHRLQTHNFTFNFVIKVTDSGMKFITYFRVSNFFYPKHVFLKMERIMPSACL